MSNKNLENLNVSRKTDENGGLNSAKTAKSMESFNVANVTIQLSPTGNSFTVIEGTNETSYDLNSNGVTLEVSGGSFNVGVQALVGRPISTIAIAIPSIINITVGGGGDSFVIGCSDIIAKQANTDKSFDIGTDGRGNLGVVLTRHENVLTVKHGLLS